MDLAAGLDHVLSDVPVNTGYLEVGAGYDQQLGGWARGEAGLNVRDNLGLYAFAQDASQTGFTAGVGAKLTFDL